MRRRFMCKSAGSCRALLFLLIFCFVGQAWAAAGDDGYKTLLMEKDLTWSEYSRIENFNEQRDATNGVSYIISGSLALVGGLVGSGVTSDPIEKGIYALFQTIGIASIGYGAYKWKVGDEERLLMETLRNSPELSNNQRAAFLHSYYRQKKQTEKNDRLIRAITHGLIAALNFYNASQQNQPGVRNTLFFIGGANMLASISYTF